jgi:hypothetical protein
MRAGAVAAAGDPGSPSSAPRSAENGLPTASARSGVHSVIRFVFAFALGADLGRVADPQVSLQLGQQAVWLEMEYGAT